jgi:RNA polymerase sigma factor (sigma-70 family)
MLTQPLESAVTTGNLQDIHTSAHFTAFNEKKSPTLKTLAIFCAMSVKTIQRIRKRDPQAYDRLIAGQKIPQRGRGGLPSEYILGAGLQAIVSLASGDMIFKIERFPAYPDPKIDCPLTHIVSVNGIEVGRRRTLAQAKLLAKCKADEFRDDVKAQVCQRLKDLMRDKESKYVRLAADWLNDSQTADDVLQDAILQAIRKSWQFDLSRDIEPWFTIVLRNQCFMRLRSLKRRGEWVGSDIMEDHEADESEPSAEFESESMSGVLSFKGPDGTMIDITLAQLLAGIPAKHRKLALALWADGEDRKALIHRYNITPGNLESITQSVRARAAANLAKLTGRSN